MKTTTPAKETKARFFDPMLLLATTSLPEGEDWEYELKLDGYRAIAFKSNGRVHLRSRNNKDFAVTHPPIGWPFCPLPDLVRLPRTSPISSASLSFANNPSDGND